MMTGSTLADAEERSSTMAAKRKDRELRIELCMKGNWHGKRGPRGGLNECEDEERREKKGEKGERREGRMNAMKE